MKALMEWVPDVSWEDYLKEIVEKQNKMVEEIVNGYEEGKMENIKIFQTEN